MSDFLCHQDCSLFLLFHSWWMVSIIKFASSSKMAAGAPATRLWFQAGNRKHGGKGEMVDLSTGPTLKAPSENFCLYLTGHSGLKGTGNTVFRVILPRKENRRAGSFQCLPQTQICSNRTQMTKKVLQIWANMDIFMSSSLAHICKTGKRFYSSLLQLREFITTQRAHLLKAAASVEFDSLWSPGKAGKIEQNPPASPRYLGACRKTHAGELAC